MSDTPENQFDLFHGNTIRIYGMSPAQILYLKRYYVDHTGDFDLKQLEDMR